MKKTGAEPKKEGIDDITYNFKLTEDEEKKILEAKVKILQEQLRLLKSPPLILAEVKEVLNNDEAVVKLENGNQFLVKIGLDAGKIEPGDSVFLEQKNLSVVRKTTAKKSFNVEQFVIIEKPKVSWESIGGLDEQIKEVQEVIELPLKKPNLFKDLGIQPPKGVLLYGPPGTGKTLLAKAVAASTKSTFIEIVASELVQKFIGEGAKLVKELFKLAREKSPSIIFIDELDALAARRIDVGTSGEREVQRTFMQLLAEIDGFKPLGKVKIIGCTNRIDILDPAILRPGRLDRLIEVPLPNEKGRLEILKIHTSKMKMKNVDLKKISKATNGFSGAELKSVCTEAGYFAIRENRNYVTEEDFKKAVKKVKKETEEDNSYKTMFG